MSGGVQVGKPIAIADFHGQLVDLLEAREFRVQPFDRPAHSAPRRRVGGLIAQHVRGKREETRIYSAARSNIWREFKPRGLRA